MSPELEAYLDKKRKLLGQLMDMVATTPIDHITEVYRETYEVASWLLKQRYRHEAHKLYDALAVTTHALTQDVLFGQAIAHAIDSLEHVEQRTRREIEFETRYLMTKGAIDQGRAVLDLYAHNHDPYRRDPNTITFRSRDPQRYFN